MMQVKDTNIIENGAKVEGNCPNCGEKIVTDNAHEVTTCPSCNTGCKFM